MKLRPVEVKDIEWFRKFALDEELQEYFRQQGQFWMYTDNQLLQLLSNHYIIDKEDGKAVGVVCIGKINQTHAQAEIGVAIVKGDYNRSLLAVNALKQLIGYCFTNLRLERIFCPVLSHRKDLIKLASAYGFKVEGVMRKNVYWQNKFHDEVLLGLLKEEYEV